MALDSVANGFTPVSKSLFRPVTQSNLRNNMSDFFNRTQEFVGDQLEGIANSNMQEKAARRAREIEEDNEPRLQPQGIGQFIDRFI